MATEQRRRRLHPDMPIAPYLGFRARPEVVDEIDRRAAEEGRNRSDIIRRLIDQALGLDGRVRAS